MPTIDDPATPDQQDDEPEPDPAVDPEPRPGPATPEPPAAAATEPVTVIAMPAPPPEPAAVIAMPAPPPSEPDAEPEVAIAMPPPVAAPTPPPPPPLFPTPSEPIVPDLDAPYQDEEKPSPTTPNREGARPAMTHVVAVINLKGGVAKTTTTVALAEAFATFQGKRVLVIDLDPQTNATLMLIGDQAWGERNKQNLTLAALFKDAVHRTVTFDYERTLMRGVSDVTGTEALDLLPSSLDMVDVQDRLAGVPQGDQFTRRPIDLLQSKVWEHLAHYDLVLIDCPPNLGIITLNGLRVADHFLIPTIPDVLSTYGIPQIVSRVKRFADEITKPIRPLGIVVTKFQANSNQHGMTERRLRDEPDGPPVFETRIPQANAISAAAEFSQERRTFRAKYGQGELAAAYVRLADEIATALDAAPAR